MSTPGVIGSLFVLLKTRFAENEDDVLICPINSPISTTRLAKQISLAITIATNLASAAIPEGQGSDY